MTDPISAAIDKTEDLIGHSPHPAVVALPLGSWALSNIADGLAMATGEDRYDDAARLGLGVGLAGAAVAVVTGLRDYAKIDKDRPSHEVATRHALGNAVVASLMTASFVLRVRDHSEGRRTGLGAHASCRSPAAASRSTPPGSAASWSRTSARRSSR